MIFLYNTNNVLRKRKRWSCLRPTKVSDGARNALRIPDVSLTRNTPKTNKTTIIETVPQTLVNDHNLNFISAASRGSQLVWNVTAVKYGPPSHPPRLNHWNMLGKKPARPKDLTSQVSTWTYEGLFSILIWLTFGALAGRAGTGTQSARPARKTESRHERIDRR